MIYLYHFLSQFTSKLASLSVYAMATSAIIRFLVKSCKSRDLELMHKRENYFVVGATFYFEYLPKYVNLYLYNKIL